MANSVDPDETARYEPSHLELHCLHRYMFWSARQPEGLTPGMQGKKFIRRNFWIFVVVFFFFRRKIWKHFINCRRLNLPKEFMLPGKNFSRRHFEIFSRKIGKYFINFSSIEFAQRVLKIKPLLVLSKGQRCSLIVGATQAKLFCLFSKKDYFLLR